MAQTLHDPRVARVLIYAAGCSQTVIPRIVPEATLGGDLGLFLEDLGRQVAAAVLL